MQVQACIQDCTYITFLSVCEIINTLSCYVGFHFFVAVHSVDEVGVDVVTIDHVGRRIQAYTTVIICNIYIHIHNFTFDGNIIL